MSENKQLTDQDLWLAAEYALGVLERRQMAAVEARLEHEPEFRKVVEGWNNQLSPLLDEVNDITPAASVWKQIEIRLQPEKVAEDARSSGAGIWKLISLLTSTAAAACIGLVLYLTDGDITGSDIIDTRKQLAQAEQQVNETNAELEVARNEVKTLVGHLKASEDGLLAEQNKVVEYNQQIADLRQQLSTGQSALESVELELESTQQALDVANAEVARIGQQTNDIRPLVASLTQSGDPPAFVAQFNPLKKALLIRTANTDDDEKVPEVWLIPAQGDRKGDVLSLGVMNEAAPDELPISDDFIPLIGEGGTLAITMEPPGGAPDGVATGPVIAIGKLQAFE
ncbi:MAG: anti-sigma factor [Pseudomonadota bacterium]